MTDYERYLVDLAVTVLREAAEAPEKEQRPSTAIMLALRVLLPHCPERCLIAKFWSGIHWAHEIERAQTVTASFNGIVNQLERSGARAKKP